MKKDLLVSDIYINIDCFQKSHNKQKFNPLPQLNTRLRNRVHSEKINFSEVLEKNFRQKNKKSLQAKDYLLQRSLKRARTQYSQLKPDRYGKKEQQQTSPSQTNKQLTKNKIKKKSLILDVQESQKNITKKVYIFDNQSKHKVKFNTLKLQPVRTENKSKSTKPQTLSEMTQDKLFKKVQFSTPLVNLYKRKNIKSICEQLSQGVVKSKEKDIQNNSLNKRYIPKQIIRNLKFKIQGQQKIDAPQTLFHKIKQQLDILDDSPQRNKNFNATEFSRKLTENTLQKMNDFFAKGPNKKFKIPTKDQYQQFLKNYHPLNQNYSMRGLIKKQNFQIVSTEKTVYFGQFTDKMHGFGLLITPEFVFEGIFQQGYMINGSEFNFDGMYTGQYVNNLREGKGRFQWNNRQIYQGEWKAGKRHGSGIWRSFNGDSYQGQWANGRQEGVGLRKTKNNIFKGEFLNSLKHGKGEEYFQNGDYYQGSYLQGKPHGFGRYTWKDGSYYEGEFANGYREGNGQLYQKNGRHYKGCFRRDFKHGMGQQIQQSGRKISGIFSNSELVSQL